MNEKTVISVKRIDRETSDTVTIYFTEPQIKLTYLAGQFLTLIAFIDGKEERRAYSLSSSPTIDEELSVTVKRVKCGKMSNYLCDHIKVGDKMMVLPPMGNFSFKPENPSRHIVLIGGGSGITPLFSIIKTALIEELASEIYLIHVNSNKESTIFYEQLAKWQSRYASRFSIINYWGEDWKNEQPKKNFFSRLMGRNQSDTHRINATRLKGLFDILQIGTNRNTQFYICGPQKMMEMATATIEKIGFSNKTIHKESFYTGSKTVNTLAKSKESHQVKILLKEKEHEVNIAAGTPILFAGLELGLDLPYSCQSGSCVSCAAKCISGQVDMDTTEGLTDEQLKEGYVLTCVGHPTSDEVVLEF